MEATPYSSPLTRGAAAKCALDLELAALRASKQATAAADPSVMRPYLDAARRAQLAAAYFRRLLPSLPVEAPPPADPAPAPPGPAGRVLAALRELAAATADPAFLAALRAAAAAGDWRGHRRGQAARWSGYLAAVEAVRRGDEGAAEVRAVLSMRGAARGLACWRRAAVEVARG